MASIDGIISGISTKDLINSMLTLEAGPQALLKTKKAGTDALVTALQSLNTKVASLAEHAAKTAKSESLNAVTGSVTQPGSGSASVGASTTPSESARPGTLSFRVDAVASAQSSLLSLPAGMNGRPSFTLTRGGEDITITADSNSLADLVEAFNAEGTGVKATLVSVDDVDTSGQPTGSRTQLLQLTSSETGMANGFTLSYEGPGGPEAVAMDQLTADADARVTLFPGTSAQRILSSASNTFEGIMTGVDLTVTEVTAAEAKPLQLTVSRDDSAARKLASGLVDNLNAILGDISSRAKATNSTAADGTEILLPGVFAGNSTIRSLQQRLQSEGAAAVGGVVAADIGIVLGRDGTYTFDAEIFDKAMSANPEGTRAVLSGFADNLAEVATANSDPISGVLTQQITSGKDTADDLSGRIKSWDDRLAARQDSLLRQFTAMEKVLSQLQGQSNYLTNILASMNTSDK